MDSEREAGMKTIERGGVSHQQIDESEKADRKTYAPPAILQETTIDAYVMVCRRNIPSGCDEGEVRST